MPPLAIPLRARSGCHSAVGWASQKLAWLTLSRQISIPADPRRQRHQAQRGIVHAPAAADRARLVEAVGRT